MYIPKILAAAKAGIARKKEIFVAELNKFDEILLVGSGKGVTSVKTIRQIGWKRKRLKHYNIFLKYYRSAIKNCDLHRFN